MLTFRLPIGDAQIATLLRKGQKLSDENRELRKGLESVCGQMETEGHLGERIRCLEGRLKELENENARLRGLGGRGRVA